MGGQYDDIIHLPHHVSATRPQMLMSDRAAQFMPFDALAGYDDVIQETGRRTDARVELGDEEWDALNQKLRFLRTHLDEKPEVSITYFKADERKAGGAYLEATGIVKKLDDFERLITMQDGEKISMDDILSMDGDAFSVLESCRLPCDQTEYDFSYNMTVR